MVIPRPILRSYCYYLVSYSKQVRQTWTNSTFLLHEIIRNGRSETLFYFLFFSLVLSRIVTRLLYIVSRRVLYDIVTTIQGDKKLLTILGLTKRGCCTLVFAWFQRTQRRKKYITWKSSRIISSANIIIPFHFRWTIWWLIIIWSYAIQVYTTNVS